MMTLSTTLSSTTYGADGSGNLSATPYHFYSGVETTGNFTYNVGYMGTMHDGAITVTLPQGWTLNGTPTASTGAVYVKGNSFMVDDLSLGLTDGRLTLTVPLITPATLGSADFLVSQRALRRGTLLPLSPFSATLVMDGLGSVTLPATTVTAGQSGAKLAFSYTASADVDRGQFEVQLPAGWTVTGTPTVTPADDFDWLEEYITVTGNTVLIGQVWMDARETFTLNVTATVGQTTGTAQFIARQKTVVGGTLTNLATATTATVVAPPPPPLATIAVNGPTQVVAGGSASFTAAGSNSFGGPVALSNLTWSADQGAISGSAAWTAPTSLGTYTITASQFGISGSITVTVVAGPVASITVTPGTGTLLTNDTLTFSASAADAFGNAVSPVDFVWAGQGGAASGAVFTAGQTPGAASITASSGGVSGSATITIEARPIPGPTPVPVTTTEGADGTSSSEARVEGTSVTPGSNLVIDLTSPDGPATDSVDKVAADFSIGALNQLQAQGNRAVIQTESVTMSVPPQAFTGLVGAPSNQGGSVGVRITVQSVDPNVAAPTGSSAFVVATQQSIQRAKSNGFTAAAQVFNFAAEVTQRDSSGTVTGTTSLTQFSAPLLVEIPYTSSGNPNLLGVYRLNPTTGTWEFRGGRVDPIRKVVIIELTGFSQYTVLEYTRQFADVPATHWAQADIQLLASREIVRGTTSSDFSPSGTVSRAQFATLLVRALKLPAAVGTTFTDVNATDWFYADVAAAAKAGLVTGSNNSFRPNDSISRQEMAVMLDRVLTLRGRFASVSPGDLGLIIGAYSDNNQMGTWAKTSIANVYSIGLMNGRTLGLFDPLATSTRAEAVVVIKRALEWLGEL